MDRLCFDMSVVVCYLLALRASPLPLLFGHARICRIQNELSVKSKIKKKKGKNRLSVCVGKWVSR